MLKRLAIFLTLTALILLGCALSDLPVRLFATRTPAPTSTPTPTQTPSPTPTPTPSPTPLPIERVETVGERLLFLGDYDRALQDYQTALREASDDEIRAGALLGIGRARYLLNDLAGAFDALNDVINNYPNSSYRARAFFHRAQVNRAREDYTAAASDLSSYLEIQPGALDAFIHEERGDDLAAVGDHQGALQAYEAAAALSSSTQPVFLQIKIARLFDRMGKNNEAVQRYMEIYNASTNDYIRAQMDLLTGQVYLRMGLSEQAYARFQDAITNYPRTYDSYSALVALIDAGQPVNQISRGLVDYYAGQYAVAVDVFNRYTSATPDHDGSAHYYQALALRTLDRNEDAVAAFDELIRDHPDDRFIADAYREKAYTQWAWLDRYEYAAATLLGFVEKYPQHDQAAALLFDAARIQERGGLLSEAAATWERVMNEYPADEKSYRALFLAGITHYRLKNYDASLTTFQRALLLATSPSDLAASSFWIGKTYTAKGDADSARAALETAANQDPTGYYSERARNLLKNRPVLFAIENYDLGYDLDRERRAAADWLRATFSLPPETVLGALGPLGNDPRVQRGDLFWQLGLYSQARDEFETLRKEITTDPVATYVLMNHLLDLGIYRSAILASRQILNLANLDDASSLTAPVYFNHIRFGVYFKDHVLAAARAEGLNPLLFLSVMRQESLFEGFAVSSAGAAGLMQIMPATGAEVAALMGMPDYDEGDLHRPVVNIPLGARYLARQRDYFDGDLYAALAGYNGGPGNALFWKNLSGNDPDLFLEVIRFDETRLYLMQIADFLNIYNRLYTNTP